ncbi:MAG: hypothetical protein A2Y07_05225 [Planctomycetes bacterium GWF2_50_10]|nr:MAG: hypothetical protein A2Y07_05225 [Planctomycetes bacterium GWF2_50_10]
MVKARFLVIILAVFGVFAGGAAGQGVFDLVPADSLFVVRVHNLEYTLGAADQYIAGLSPMPMALSMLARMQMGMAVGDANLAGIDMRGDWAVFVMTTGVPVGTPKCFSVIVFPTSDYDKMLANNPTATKPDANGIASIGANGVFMVAKIGDYGLLLTDSNYKDALAAIEAVKGETLGKRAGFVGPDDKSLIWVRANVEELYKNYGPMVNEKFDKAFSGTNCKGEPREVPEFVKLYVNMVRNGFAQTKDISIGLNFDANLAMVDATVTPVINTGFDTLLASVSTEARAGHELLAFLPGDSAFAFSHQVDKRFMLQAREMMLDAFAPAFGPSFTPEKRKEGDELAAKMVEHMGNEIAAAFGPADDNVPPFAYTYIMPVSTSKTFNELKKEYFKLMNEQYYKDFYSKFGMTGDFKLESTAENYNNTAIDTLSMSFKCVDPNSPASHEIKKMYGDTFVEKIAYVDGLGLHAIGGDANENIRALIDKAKAKSNELPQSIAAAVAALGGENHQMVGMLNVVNLLKIAAKMPGVHMNKAACTQSGSGIAIGADVTNKAVKIKAVVPKSHMMEVKGI